jgi:hypothetical protein
MMTPKEQYEARKAERLKLKDMDFQVREKTTTLMMMDMLDRFVTAAERIADAMERPQPLVTTFGLTPDPNSASGFKTANTFGSGSNTGGTKVMGGFCVHGVGLAFRCRNCEEENLTASVG